MKSEQETFDATYITSIEICEALAIKRSTISQARRRGKLPDPIVIKRPDGEVHVLLWPRATLMPMLDAWKRELSAWRASRA